MGFSIWLMRHALLLEEERDGNRASGQHTAPLSHTSFVYKAGSAEEEKKKRRRRRKREKGAHRCVRCCIPRQQGKGRQTWKALSLSSLLRGRAAVGGELNRRELDYQAITSQLIYIYIYTKSRERERKERRG